jgi:hypothetical protein
VLSNASKRQEYDLELSKQQRARRLSFKKLKRMLSDCWENLRSDVLLWRHQWQQGEEVDLWSNIKEHFLHTGTVLWQLAEHFCLLPSATDRVSLYHELWNRGKLTIAAVVVGSAMRFH